MPPDKTTEQIFWHWFTENAARYFAVERDQENLFDLLGKKLSVINPELSFEFSPVLEENKREFIISASGIQTAFPAVINLIRAAPTLPQWIFIAFRQPKPDLSHIHYDGVVLDVDDVYFRYAEDDEKIGIELNIKNYKDKDNWNVAVYLLLDAVIGEYETETTLSWIEKKKLDKKEIPVLFPIIELPQIIATYRTELAKFTH